MDESELALAVADGSLDARLAHGRRRELVVIGHPHPLYGGDMDNHVVLAIRDAAAAAGFATLRYNSRGVGRSDGTYGGGHGETEDLVVVLEQLAEHEQAREGLHLAGYSFGAWVTLAACARTELPRTLVLVSLPIDLLPVAQLDLPPVPCLLATGARDPFCTPASLERWLGEQPSQRDRVALHVFADCDHFYAGHAQSLERAINAFWVDQA